MRKFVYSPGDGEALSTEMFGLKFPANVPVAVTDKHGAKYDLTEKFEVDGMPRSRTVNKWISAADSLAHNPMFRELVDDKAHKHSERLLAGTKIAEGWKVDEKSPLETIGTRAG